MKFIILALIAIVQIVSSYRHTESVSEYSFKTVHEVPDVPEKKLDDELEAKLEVLNRILKEHQLQTRKTQVEYKTEVQGEEPEAVVEETESKDKVRNYEFGYGVKDPKTGDFKDQWEKRVGGKVKGIYKFAESDGTQRVVEYEADDKKGFEAKVKNVKHSESEEVEEKKEKVVEKPKEGDKSAQSYSYVKKYFS